MNGPRPPLTAPAVFAGKQTRGDSKKCCRPSQSQNWINRRPTAAHEAVSLEKDLLLFLCLFLAKQARRGCLEWTGKFSVCPVAIFGFSVLLKWKGSSQRAITLYLGLLVAEKDKRIAKTGSRWTSSRQRRIYKKHLSPFFRPLLSPSALASVSGVSSTCWKVTATTTPARMLMYGKEARNQKQEIGRQHYTIPNQRS